MSDLTKQSELKNCPFCGSEGHTLLQGFRYADDCPDRKEPAVMCPTCEARAPVKAWNTRPASAGVREALDIAISALEFVRDGYERTDIKHVDYRVNVYVVASDALDRISALSDHGVQESGGSWRPIESAPRDGTGILVKLPDSDMPHTAKFWRGSWTVAWDHSELKGWDAPTHWMPIPELPSDSLLSKTLSEGEQRSIATKQSTDATSASGLSPALRAYQALFEPPESDAYDNLTGALLDIKRHIEADRPTDDVCVRTIERVLDQLNAAYTALAPANEGSSLRPDGGASS